MHRYETWLRIQDADSVKHCQVEDYGHLEMTVCKYVANGWTMLANDLKKSRFNQVVRSGVTYSTIHLDLKWRNFGMNILDNMDYARAVINTFDNGYSINLYDKDYNHLVCFILFDVVRGYYKKEGRKTWRKIDHDFLNGLRFHLERNNDIVVQHIRKREMLSK